MATSESDDFESADEEMNYSMVVKNRIQTQQWNSPTTIDSESDDDTEYVPRIPHTSIIFSSKTGKYCSLPDARTDENSIKDTHNYAKLEQPITGVDRICEKSNENVTFPNLKEECVETNISTTNLKVKDNNKESMLDKNEIKAPLEKDANMELHFEGITVKSNEKEEDLKKQKLGVRKLGTKIKSSNKFVDDTDNVDTHIHESMAEENILLKKPSIKEEITESEMPEEMKLDKKFKEVFKPEGWEGLGKEIELPEELTEEKLQPILKRLSVAGQEAENSSMGWGWANWGVSSLINTAGAGVSTLSSHVSHGLTLLEESMAIPDECKSITNEKEEDDHIIKDDKQEQPKEQSSFGFGNLISGVSSITKLVESTGSKVMSGGLDTLEAIGKKTMEVLQDGDPGLKKKRAFLFNEPEKPNLSQILREAKEKTDAIEKTMEEKQKMRKVHFETLFDDYQGLVHLEALEMLSKQSNIKIQQHLIGLDTNELCSIQKMLEDVEELCELDKDDDNEDEMNEKDLKSRLQEACSDLGINLTFEKLHDISEDCKAYTTPSMMHNDQEIFEHAVSVLAQFTAFSVERFHKTAELLLIKTRRSTVDEADSLVQLANILSNEIETLAHAYCICLDVLVKTSDTPDSIQTNITTIFKEAGNASSYIQDAFKLLIPIIQVGAI
ncbi:Protein FAM114A2 [Habropoda laboriosa]|uniref:Protein FAM114A2 n=1 Tax=Habropoda laboriosa TaxID=597456 RepID=A0A0L7QR93_9HYME|nr:PREDICTED: protein FAM114A2 [Habropoda laboriosa]KOC61150.1 Protein FAM114A2 [Habropoda laboriosa]